MVLMNLIIYYITLNLSLFIPIHAFYINRGALLERKKVTIIKDNAIET